MAQEGWKRGWDGWEISFGGWKRALGDWKMGIGNCKMDLLAGNMHFSKVFGGRGPGTCIFLGFLGVREAAGGRQVGRMTLEPRFAGRWGGAYGGEIEN